MTTEQGHTTEHPKVWENRLRRMAERQGYKLHKSRRRDPRAIDFGAWWIVRETAPGGDWRSREMVAGHDGGLSLAEVEEFLTA